jgi:hypothetical protein
MSTTPRFTTTPSPRQQVFAIEDLSIEQILQCQQYTRLFHLFLQRYHNVELLDFVCDYKEQALDAKELVSLYVKPGARFELNIQQRLRTKILESEEINYQVLNELNGTIKLLLKESCFPTFKTSAEYKQILVEQYSREFVLKHLESKDISEWNTVEVYLYFHYHEMNYILEHPDLLGKFPQQNLNGAKLFMFIDEDISRVSHLIQLGHIMKLKKLIDNPPAMILSVPKASPRVSPRSPRMLTFNCSFNNNKFTVQMDQRELVKMEQVAVSVLKQEIRKYIQTELVIHLKMKDKDGDYLPVRTWSDLKYILAQDEQHYQVTVTQQ